MVNCMPVFIAREPYWQRRFEQAGVPIIGDDIKSQVGATITHRVLTSLFRERGVHLDKTMQLNVGGNSDFLNMLERERLESKKISKTNAVTSMLDYDLGPGNVHVGPSDYVPWLTDRKWAYIRMEGSSFGDVPLNVELKLEVWDSPNSAGIVIDAVRLAKLALDNGDRGRARGAERLPDEVAAEADRRRRGARAVGAVHRAEPAPGARAEGRREGLSAPRPPGRRLASARVGIRGRLPAPAPLPWRRPRHELLLLAARGARHADRRPPAGRPGRLADVPHTRRRARQPLGRPLPRGRHRHGLVRRPPLLRQGARGLLPRHPGGRGRAAAGAVGVAPERRPAPLGRPPLDRRPRPARLRLSRRQGRRGARPRLGRRDARDVRDRDTGRLARSRQLRRGADGGGRVRCLPARLAAPPRPGRPPGRARPADRVPGGGRHRRGRGLYRSARRPRSRPLPAGLLPGLALLGLYDRLAFGSPFHLSYRYVSQQFASQQAGGFFGIGAPSWHAVSLVLVGNRGLLVDAPVLVLAAAGLVLLGRAGFVAEAVTCAAVTVAFLVLEFGYFDPYGGDSPGPRFFIPAIPFLVLGLAPAFARFRLATSLLAAASVVASTAVLLTWPAAVNAAQVYRWSVWRELASLPVHGTSALIASWAQKNLAAWVDVGRLKSAVLVTAAALGALALALRDGWRSGATSA